ncbi:MAG TPA: RICIN domain-containing protein [Thermoanaerobaculia bacterium]|nr:RICIN domain-containing protein [Thermoanaerobaculia bacterium]
MKRTGLLLSAAVALTMGCGTTSAQAFDADAFYRLTTEWQGECRSLDVINDGTNDQVALRKTADVAGQYWRIAADGAFFRLSTQWVGAGKSLDIRNDGRNDTPVLATTGDVSGQHWRIVPLGDGYCRLTTEWQGPGKSLDIKNDGRNDRPVLARTGNFSGQRWRITKETAVGPVPPALGLAPFYKKYLDGDGIPIVSSEKVSDSALLQVRFLARQMLSRLPAAREELRRRNVRIAVMAPLEVATDIPEHAFLRSDTSFDWDRNTRGLGATLAVPVSSCAQENLLCEADTHYPREDIFIHEFAHTIHELGLDFTDRRFQSRLDAAYLHAATRGLWRRTYAAKDTKEYWAEGVQDWFDVNDKAIPTNGIHNDVNTRSELRSYDTRLHDLIAEYFPADQNKCSCH